MNIIELAKIMPDEVKLNLENIHSKNEVLDYAIIYSKFFLNLKIGQIQIDTKTKDILKIEIYRQYQSEIQSNSEIMTQLKINNLTLNFI